MDKILFVNACVRQESRTQKIADYLLEKLAGEVTVLNLQEEKLLPLNHSRLLERNQALANGEMEHESLRYARQFATADVIVIAAPYWDLSFPSLLKAYIEAICAVGVTFAYDEQERPYGLCRATRLYYVTTAGGPILSDEFGYGYIRALCETFYGMKETYYIKAEGLDMFGADVEQILEKTKEKVDLLFGRSCHVIP